MEINFGDGILMHQGKIHINVLLLLKIYKKKLIFYRNIKKWPKLQKQRSEDRGKEKLEFCLAEKKRPRSKFSLVGKKERKASLVGGEQNAT